MDTVNGNIAYLNANQNNGISNNRNIPQYIDLSYER
jgi:hypothetical protein